MKNKQNFSRLMLLLGLSVAVMLSLAGCAAKVEAQQPVENPVTTTPENPTGPVQTGN